MSIEEIQKELADIENSLFYLFMTDRWDDGDFKKQDKLYDRKHELEEELRRKGVEM